MQSNLKVAVWLVALFGIQSCNQNTQFQSSQNPRTAPPQVNPVESADQLPPPIIRPGDIYQRLFLTTETDRVTESFEANKKYSGITIPIRENQRQESLQLPITDVHTENVRHQPTSRKERFTQKVQPHPMDLVVVVDDSRSMAEAHAKIQKNLTSIVEQLGDTHWRVAVTTTSIYLDNNARQKSPCLLGVLDRYENGSAKDFKNLVGKIGVGGYGYERGLERSIRALGCTVKRQRWTRENAMLGIVVVSDEDDCTNTAECTTRQQDVDYSKFIESLRFYSQKYYTSKFYALVAVPGEDASNRYKIDDECFAKNPITNGGEIAFTPGKAYEKVVDYTDGIMACVWEDSYSGIFGKISTDLVSNVQKQFQLKHVPVREGMVVKVDGVDVTNDVTVEDKTIKFNNTPKAHQTIDVEYSHLTDEPLKEHQLANKPIPETVSIKLDDRPLNENEYSIDANGKITFNTDIATGSTVAIDFKSVRENIFAKLNRKADYSSLTVTQNGQPFSGYTVDPATGLLTVDKSRVSKNFAPIIINYAVSEGTVLHYPIDRTGLKGEFKGVYRDLEMLEKIDGATIQGDQIVFKDGTVAIDDSVQAMFEERTQLGNYPLSFLPVLGREVTVKAPSHCAEGTAVVEGQKLKLTCTLGSNDKVEVNYSKLVARKTVFDFDQVDQPDNCSWKVTVVGSEKPVEFIREGTKIFVQDELPLNAKVKIVAQIKVQK